MSNRFHGVIGYVNTVRTAPGVTVLIPEERHYTGDLVRNYSTWQSNEQVNEDIALKNRISVVADEYAYNNFQWIKYISWRGAKWKVVNVEVNHPRLILTLGGVYNE